VEKFKQSVALQDRPFVFAEPSVIEGDVHGCAPGIETKVCMAGFPGRLTRGSVKPGIIGSQSSLRVSCFFEKSPTGGSRLLPELAALFIPQRPEFVKVRQVIGGIGEIIQMAYGHKDHLFLIKMEQIGDHERTVCIRPFVEHGVENELCFSLIVEQPLAAPPAGCGEIQSGDEPLFAIGSRVVVDPGSIGPAVPGEIASMRTASMLHIRFRPFPQPVELGFPVQLHGDHHSVGHAFGPDILIVDI